MSEATDIPEAIEGVPHCPNCYSDNVRQIAAFYNTYECADCRLIFDSSISYDPYWFEDELDWDDGES